MANPSNIKTVDMEVLSAVYKAAHQRLQRVRSAQTRELGVALTNMTDIGRSALTEWKPTPAAIKNAAPRRPDTITIIRREDGSTTAKCELCPFSQDNAPRAEVREHAKSHTKTFRFTMSRKAYDEIKSAIHDHGLSVSAVVQDGLERFARTGQF